MAAGVPGRPVRGSQTGRPIMALLDLFGRRWTLRILWELFDSSPASFRELRDRCDDMSPSVLNQRLRELRDARIVELGDEGFDLTKEGRELMTLFKPVSTWAKGWGRRMARSGPSRMAG